MVNPPSEFKRKRHRAGKITREYRDASRFRRIKRLELNSRHIFVKSEKRVFFPESFISALKAKAKFLFYLPENFISQKFLRIVTSNIEFDSFYNYYLEIIKNKDTIENPSLNSIDLITQLRSQLPENQCEIESYLQTLQ